MLSSFDVDDEVAALRLLDFCLDVSVLKSNFVVTSSYPLVARMISTACRESTYISDTSSVIGGRSLGLGVHVKQENRRKSFEPVISWYLSTVSV